MFRWFRYPKVYVEFADKKVVLEPIEFGAGLPLPIAGRYEIEPHSSMDVETGIKMALPARYYAAILPMPAAYLRHNLMVLPHVIEPGDDDIIYVPVFNLSKAVDAVLAPKTSPIAQLVIMKRRVFNIVPVPSVKAVNEWLGVK